MWEWFDQHWPDEVEWPAGILRKLPFARREEAAIQMLPAQPGAEGRAVATSPAAQEVAA